MNQVRMKKKPVKPSLVRNVDYHIRNGDSLKKLSALSADGKIKFSDYTGAYYSYPVPESDDAIKRKMQAYEKAIKEYNQWYEANREQIETQILEARRIKEEKAALKKEMFDLTRRTREVREKINNLR